MATSAYHLRTDYLIEAFGIDNPRPEFSWRLEASDPSDKHAVVFQNAYRLQVATLDTFKPTSIVWDSDIVRSQDQSGIVYAGGLLQSITKYYWRVQLFDMHDMCVGWSRVATFETGIMDARLWKANWITGPIEDTEHAMYFRGCLTIPAGVLKGRAFVSALGWYRFFVNGTDLTGNCCVPRWTPLTSAVEYQDYDITQHLRPGLNHFSVVVGDGRWRGSLGLRDTRAKHHDPVAAFVQVNINFKDGNRIAYGSSEEWLAGTGAIIRSDPKLGEEHDLRIGSDEWLGTVAPTPPGVQGSRWTRACLLHTQHWRKLIAEETPRTKEIARIRPKGILRSPSGKQIFDFGENIAGYVVAKLKGKSGTKVTITYSESVRPDGELDLDYTLPIDGRAQQDICILGGKETVFQPWFTRHGFRYAEIDGSDDVSFSDIKALVVSTDLTETGMFTCSDWRLERWRANALRSMRGNFADIITDCPTRERLCWMGDLQAISPTSTMFLDTQTYLRRMMRNIAIEQLPDGTVPPFLPGECAQVYKGLWWPMSLITTSVGWGDACVLVPWTIYLYYGDKAVLKRQYGSMKKKMEQMVRDARNGRGGYGKYYKGERNEHEPYILDSDKMWGEWLEPGSGMWGLFKSLMIPSPNTATAYFAHNASILAKAAEALGYTQDAEHYRQLSERVREAWHAAFVYSDNRIGDDKQDDYVRALAFNLIPESSRHGTMARLVEIIEDSDYHFGTTLLNTAMLLGVLSEHGRADVAYKLVLNNQPRTFLNQIEAGATTIWETWTGYDETGKAKGSHNHVASGACTRWLQEGIIGISPLEPGYRKIRVRPLVGGGLEHAAGSIDTPFGTCKSSWRVLAATGMIQLGVTIPAGASGEIHLGNGEIHDVPAGTHFFEWQGSNTIPTPGSPAPSFTSVATVVPDRVNAASPPQSPGGTLMMPSPFNPATPKMATSGGRLLPPSVIPQGISKQRIDSVNSMAGVAKPTSKSFALPQNGGVISWPPRAAT
ncbi:glycoside hydrolase family 78 protein, partial [Aureobasidium melanogenum]|uniref:alpha-L-rhamnosidase n=1 Tax=Aureobasidium melanogenum (strain CBS 110374) TaxID=1043003 RepID=A0A074VYQ0_AURM1